MATKTANAADRFARVRDLNLHHLEWGDPAAAPVIMVHGLTGNAHAFDNLAAHFATRYHVISVDVRGRSDSDLLSPEIARRMLAEMQDCRMVEVPGVGHAPTLMEPEACGPVMEFFSLACPGVS
ncbi:MAG: hypothetical protein OXG17_09055 [Chloroflexi bacterium]|nr:hypothetical protein [Chloroflexota bacterium]